MEKKTSIKPALYEHIMSLLNQKVAAAMEAVESLRQSRNSDTKSTAGDKHETGRAMMQIELENCEVQLTKALMLRNQFFGIDIDKVYNEVEPGSMVFTNTGTYFISSGLGKVDLNNSSYYVISMASPIGQALQGKKAGDLLTFQGKEIIIKIIF